MSWFFVRFFFYIHLKWNEICASWKINISIQKNYTIVTTTFLFFLSRKLTGNGQASGEKKNKIQYENYVYLWRYNEKQTKNKYENTKAEKKQN